jgi:predicted nuclease of predicted toxin-antitoxin system
VRFYLDEDLSDRIARIAREAGLDVVSSHETGRDRLPDREQLRLAALDGRCLVTINGRHYIRLTEEFLVTQRPHLGVLIIARSLLANDFAGVARALATFAAEHPDDLPGYTVQYLSARHLRG